jgi:hypothetical protein
VPSIHGTAGATILAVAGIGIAVSNAEHKMPFIYDVVHVACPVL